MYVCICNRINDKAVAASIGTLCTGSQSACAEDVYARLGVKPQCGQCACTIDDMIDDHFEAAKVAAE